MEKTEQEQEQFNAGVEALVAEMCDAAIDAAFEEGWEDAERAVFYRRLAAEINGYADCM